MNISLIKPLLQFGAKEYVQEGVTLAEIKAYNDGVIPKLYVTIEAMILDNLSDLEAIVRTLEFLFEGKTSAQRNIYTPTPSFRKITPTQLYYVSTLNTNMTPDLLRYILGRHCLLRNIDVSSWNSDAFAQVLPVFDFYCNNCLCDATRKLTLRGKLASQIIPAYEILLSEHVKTPNVALLEEYIQSVSELHAKLSGNNIQVLLHPAYLRFVLGGNTIEYRYETETDQISINENDKRNPDIEILRKHIIDQSEYIEQWFDLIIQIRERLNTKYIASLLNYSRLETFYGLSYCGGLVRFYWFSTQKDKRIKIFDAQTNEQLTYHNINNSISFMIDEGILFFIEKDKVGDLAIDDETLVKIAATNPIMLGGQISYGDIHSYYMSQNEINIQNKTFVIEETMYYDELSEIDHFSNFPEFARWRTNAMYIIEIEKDESSDLCIYLQRFQPNRYKGLLERCGKVPVSSSRTGHQDYTIFQLRLLSRQFQLL